MLLKIKNFLPQSAQSFLKRYVGQYRLYKARKEPCTVFLPNSRASKIRVLFFDSKGLAFAGTQKFLQILSKHLDKNKFEVFFMYSSKLAMERLDYFKDSGVKLIDFDFISQANHFPYNFNGMNPHLFDVLKEHQINLLVATGSGYPEFPVANITKLPIIYINVFGSINPQNNIYKYICISPYLQRIVSSSLPDRSVETMYIQSERPPQEAEKWGKDMRESLGLRKNDFLFGRIGRPDNNIFDPIGLLAFEKLLKLYPYSHYLIMAPSENCRKLVNERVIKNVHYLPPSGKERDIWSFHYAIDAMAHFRKDGETQGANITETMLAGKPVISHKARVWNAHVEYLDSSFSRVANIDAVEEYGRYMEEFIKLKQQGKLEKMGELARHKGEAMCLIENNIQKFEQWIKNSQT